MPSLQAQITDICQRVFGWQVQVSAEQLSGVWQVHVVHAKPQDPLTRSAQEMDVIMSLQHQLDGAAIRLVVD
jgi:hypothetical protein